MKNLLPTFAAVLLSAWLLSLLCLPEPKSTSCRHGVDVNIRLVFEGFGVGDLPEQGLWRAASTRCRLVSSDLRRLSDLAPEGPEPGWRDYAARAAEDLCELLEADNIREAKACLRLAWWDVQDAWGAYRGEAPW